MGREKDEQIVFYRHLQDPSKLDDSSEFSSQIRSVSSSVSSLFVIVGIKIKIRRLRMIDGVLISEIS